MRKDKISSTEKAAIQAMGCRNDGEMRGVLYPYILGKNVRHIHISRTTLYKESIDFKTGNKNNCWHNRCNYMLLNNVVSVLVISYFKEINMVA